MRELTREHAAKAPPNQQYRPPVVNLVKPPAKQLQRVRFRADIGTQAPRMHSPARPSGRAADVHRRSIAGQETRKDERRRPVLRTSRADGTKPRQITWKMPGDFAKAVPARRRKVVRVNRAGNSGSRGPRPFHDSQDDMFSFPKQ